MLLQVAGALGGTAASSFTFSGSLSATSASTPITSTTRTVTGNGTARFELVVGPDPEYNKNGAGWNNITEGLTLVLANTDTLAVRENTLAVPGDTTFSIINDDTGATVQAVTLTRT